MTPIPPSLTESLSPTKRVAIIEVGSRAVRLLVADVSAEAGLKVIMTRAAQVGLIRAVQAGPAALDRTLDKIQSHISEFRDVVACLENPPDRVLTVGTAAVRLVAASGGRDTDSRLSGIDVVGNEQEALCSLYAAIIGTKRESDQSQVVLVIDQGGGSTEIALGRGPTPTLELINSASIDIGHEKLVKMLHAVDFNMNAFRLKLTESIDVANIKYQAVDRAFVLGSCATKYAWIKIRKNEKHIYEPNLVHDSAFSVKTIISEMKQINKIPKASWPAMRAFTEPRDPSGTEFDMVVTGMIMISALCERFGVKEFAVSSLGTRHGLAWILAMRPTLLDMDSG